MYVLFLSSFLRSDETISVIPSGIYIISVTQLWYKRSYLKYEHYVKAFYIDTHVIARLEFELAYNDFAVYCFNYYTTRTPQQPEVKNLFNRGEPFYI